MAFLAWVSVPLLRDELGGRDPFIESLLTCLNAGLLWVLALTLVLLRREQGQLEWSRVVDGLWLSSSSSASSALSPKRSTVVVTSRSLGMAPSA